MRQPILFIWFMYTLGNIYIYTVRVIEWVSKLFKKRVHL